MDFFFHKDDALSFSFLQIPLVLIKDPLFSGLSADAKLLYGLLLNRASLSLKNNWIDNEGRVYLYYKIEEVCSDLGIKKTKATQLFKELTNVPGTDFGLIKKERQMNMPSRIYVLNFQSLYEFYSSTANTVDGEPQMRSTVGRKHGRRTTADAVDRIIIKELPRESNIDSFRERKKEVTDKLYEHFDVSVFADDSAYLSFIDLLADTLAKQQPIYLNGISYDTEFLAEKLESMDHEDLFTILEHADAAGKYFCDQDLKTRRYFLACVLNTAKGSRRSPSLTM